MAPSSHIVVGLGFGDEGKGTIVDALVRRTGASAVVRFNGGGQAAHNVVTEDGRHHTFSLWGSGTLAGADTILTDKVLVDPLAMAAEAEHLEAIGVRDPYGKLYVDGDALLVTPYHRAMNRIREHARGKNAHGSCGVGIGEAMLDMEIADADEILRVRDLRDPDGLAWKLQVLAFRKAAEASALLRGRFPVEVARDLNTLWSDGFHRDIFHGMRHAAQRLQIGPWEEIAPTIRRGNLVFEGAQGVLLDEWRGFHPHTTWSTTTQDNAVDVLERAGAPETDPRPVVIGVTRAYATRHGAGPFPTWNQELAVPEREHNSSASRQGAFRIGALDMVLLRYAALTEPDYLAVTCCDHPHAKLPPCVGYRHTGEDSPTYSISDNAAEMHDLSRQERRGKLLWDSSPIYNAFGKAWTPDQIADEIETPLMVTSQGPTAADKLWR